MKLTDKQKKWVDIIQWVLIFVLIGVCVFDYCGKHSEEAKVNADIQRENTYMRIYDSQRIESLKKENRALHDSIKSIRDAEIGMEVRYIVKHQTDTLRVTEFVKDEVNDSIYHYTFDNDTVRTNIDVKAAELDWVKSSFQLKDKFTIINAEKDGENRVYVEHSPNVSVDGLDVWHREPKEKKWYDHVRVGPAVGVGYGVMTGKVDVWLGGAVIVTF